MKNMTNKLNHLINKSIDFNTHGNRGQKQNNGS